MEQSCFGRLRFNANRKARGLFQFRSINVADGGDWDIVELEEKGVMANLEVGSIWQPIHFLHFIEDHSFLACGMGDLDRLLKRHGRFVDLDQRGLGFIEKLLEVGSVGVEGHRRLFQHMAR